MRGCCGVLALAGTLVTCSSPRGPPRSDGAINLDSLRVRGESLYYRAAYDSARLLWARGLAQSRTSADTAATAQFLTWLGLLARKAGDYATARAVGESALVLKHLAGLRDQLFRSYNALGLVAWEEGRLSDAVALFDSAAGVARQSNGARELVTATGNLALVNVELGAYADARAGFQDALSGARTIGDTRLEANNLNNLGALDIRIGDPADAIALLEEARRLLHARGDANEQNTLGQLGTAYHALGDYRRAIAALDSGLAFSRRTGVRAEEVTTLEALARVYADAGDRQRALALYAEADSLNTTLGLEVERGADLRSVAEIHASLSDLDLATRSAREALAIHRHTGARGEELGDLLLLATLAERAGQRGIADRELGAARVLARRVASRASRADVALAAARLAEGRRRPRAVLAVLDDARLDLVGTYGPGWQADLLAARAYLALGQDRSAVDAARRAVAAVEQGRSHIGSGALRTAWVSDKADAYTVLVAALLRLGLVDEAFEASDAARGRALVEHLASVESGEDSPDTATALLHEGEDRRGRIAALVARLDSVETDLHAAPDSNLAVLARSLGHRLVQERAEYAALLGRLAEHGDRGRLLGVVTARTAEVEGSIAEDEAVLELFVAPDRLHLFVLTAAGVRHFESPVDRTRLTVRVRLARELAGAARGSAAAGSPLAALYDLLIRPAQRAGALAGLRRLVIVPHDLLSYVPFAALRDDSSSQWLVERYALIVLPTASALPVLRRGAAAAGVRRTTVLAPFPDQLPASRTEAVALREVLPRPSVRLAGGASEAWARQALAKGDVLHVASHGTLDARNPLFSYVALAPGRRSAPNDDGRLEAHEILGLHIASPLVFLSGCETGLGVSGSTAYTTGEDYTTLAQAFLYAGAGGVVSTLWRVEDDGAAALAERFYRHSESMASPEALAAAQRDLLSQPRYKEPFYWAGYVFSGRGAAQNRAALSVRR
jgi:CHAT domain-containing protein/tetratricopeptide (TPR) repeat protein